MLGPLPEPFPPAWRDVVARRLGAWSVLSPEQRDRLGDFTARLITEKYRDITSTIVHSTTIHLPDEHAGPIPGSRTCDPLRLLGEAHYKGPAASE